MNMNCKCTPDIHVHYLASSTTYSALIQYLRLHS